jgi:hypothetical protein
MRDQSTTAKQPMIVAQDVHKWYGSFHARRFCGIER